MPSLYPLSRVCRLGRFQCLFLRHLAADGFACFACWLSCLACELRVRVDEQVGIGGRFWSVVERRSQIAFVSLTNSTGTSQTPMSKRAGFWAPLQLPWYLGHASEATPRQWLWTVLVGRPLIGLGCLAGQGHGAYIVGGGGPLTSTVLQYLGRTLNSILARA